VALTSSIAALADSSATSASRNFSSKRASSSSCFRAAEMLVNAEVSSSYKTWYAAVARAEEFFRVGQDALLRLQLQVFARLKPGCFDLFFLEAPQVDHAKAVLLIAIKLRQPLADPGPESVLFPPDR